MLNLFLSNGAVALVVLLICLCTVSDTIKYITKFTIFVISSAIFASLPVPIMLLRPRNWRNALIPAFLLRQMAKLLGFNFFVRGQENIVKDSGAVVVINHQSALDLIVLAELWPVIDRCTVVSKKIILFFGIFGMASWLWGTIFINRSDVKGAQAAINSTANEINKRRAKLLLFPEGTRNSKDTLMPFKKGAFHVAIASQTPIQPVVVSKYYFIDSKLKKFDSGTTYITILPAIPTKGMTKDDLPDLLNKTYELMNKEFQQATKEVLEVQKFQDKID